MNAVRSSCSFLAVNRAVGATSNFKSPFAFGTGCNSVPGCSWAFELNWDDQGSSRSSANMSGVPWLTAAVHVEASLTKLAEDCSLTTCFMQLAASDQPLVAQPVHAITAGAATELATIEGFQPRRGHSGSSV